jgi:hypothetical protein
MKNRNNGYYSVPRHISDHPIFSRPRTKRFDRKSAFDWLWRQAAWRAENASGDRGIFHLRRGQLCITVRDLGKIWGWPRSTVHKYLKELTRESLILLGSVRAGTKSWSEQPQLKLGIGYNRTLITICNYDVKESLSTVTAEKSSNWRGQKRGQSHHLPNKASPQPAQRVMATGIGLVKTDKNPKNLSPSSSVVAYGDSQDVEKTVAPRHNLKRP